MLLSAPVPGGGNAERLAYLDRRQPRSMSGETPLETSLARAVAMWGGGYPPVPPPMPPGKTVRPQHRSYFLARLRALLSFGADPNERSGRDPSAWTPLALAVAADREDFAVLLLLAGADPNARWCRPFEFETRQRRRPLAPASQAGCTQHHGTTPVMLAAKWRSATMVSLLLEYGADRNARDWDGKTALDYALRFQNAAAADVLRGRP